MVNVSNLKLRSQLTLLICIAIIMMIIIQIFYYFSFYSLTKKRAQSYFNDYSSQIQNKILSNLVDIENISSIISNSQNIQKFIIKRDQSADKLELLNSAMDNLNYSAASNNGIQSILIMDYEGTRVKSSTDYKSTIYWKIIEDYKLEEMTAKKPFYTKSYYDESSHMSYFAFINPIYSVLPGEFRKDSIGVCITLCYANRLQQKIANTLQMSDLTFVLTEQQNIIGSNRSDMIGRKLNDIMDIHRDRNEILYNNQLCLAQITGIEQTGWEILCFIPLEKLVNDMEPTRNIGILIIVFSTFLLITAGLILIRSITVPISRIIKDMDTVGEKDIKYRLKAPSNNEIGKIAFQINCMLEKIELLTGSILAAQDGLYAAELSKKQAELSFYQSQINPHFLYNTLECIRSISLEHKVFDVVKITTAMAKIFRYSVKEDDIVKISDELNCIKYYFSIISMRFIDKFSLDVQVDPSLFNVKIIKMVLQPIIENAIQHGFAGRKHGVITVRGYSDPDGDAIIEISDNGRGISEDACRILNEDINSGRLCREDTSNERSIGLLNINTRMKLNYGPAYGIKISSRPEYGLTVRMRLPKTE